MNVSLKYMYRDAGNYKNWGNVIFTNRHKDTLDDLDKRIRPVLLDGCCFSASSMGLPALYFAVYDEELDHGWHEYNGLEETDAVVTDEMKRDIGEFITALERVNTE